jgi:hypothetical protein
MAIPSGLPQESLRQPGNGGSAMICRGRRFLL